MTKLQYDRKSDENIQIPAATSTTTTTTTSTTSTTMSITTTRATLTKWRRPEQCVRTR